MADTAVRGAHLVGSMALDSAADVFHAAGTHLRSHLRRVPDGEPGERDNWLVFQSGVFDRHPDVEPAERPGEGYAAVLPAYQLRGGVDPSTVDLTPLGYADAAESSYAIFRELRGRGELPDGARFQVSLPTPLAIVAAFVIPKQQPVLEPVYERALLTELRRIQDAIPAEDLAVQWDIAIETAMWEEVGGLFTPWFDDTSAGTLDRIARVAAAVDDGVELGFHLCYGDFGHEHFVQPRDTANLTEMANGIIDRVSRRVNWIHLPVPIDRDDPDYFAALRDLRLPEGTELYLGLVHAGDPEGTRRRIDAAGAVVPSFGVATECGMGRTPREQIDGLLSLHADVAQPVR